jgi:DNA-binding transcriptional LysR family regulator
MRENVLTADLRRQRADWSDLRIFWAVVEAGGFAAAGRALGIGQPTVTRRVEDLESRLNTKLLIRSPAGISMTEAGALIHDHVQTMERCAAQIEHLALNKDRREEGRVTLSAPDGVGSLLLAPAVADFARMNPRIGLSLDCGMWPDNPVSGDNDISLTFDRPDNPDMICTRLASFHYGLFAARGYLDLYGTPRTLAEAAGHRAVIHSAYGREKESWGQKTSALRDLAVINIETNSSSALLNAVKAGAGIAPMPTYVAVLEPELVMLDFPPLAKPTLWMCHHRDIARAARIQRVADWLIALFDQREKPWYRAEFIPPSEFSRDPDRSIEADLPPSAPARARRPIPDLQV